MIKAILGDDLNFIENSFCSIAFSIYNELIINLKIKIYYIRIIEFDNKLETYNKYIDEIEILLRMDLLLQKELEAYKRKV